MREQGGGELVDDASDEQARVRQQFVATFDSFWTDLGLGEPTDSALREAAWLTGLPVQELRVARYLRDALAQDKWVDRSCLDWHLAMLVKASTPPDVEEEPTHQPVDQPWTAALRIHAWQDRTLERHMIADGFVSIGGDEIGDLTGVDDPVVIREALTDSMPDRSASTISTFVGYWRRFLWEVEIGDLVVLPTQTLGVAIGEFAGPYVYVNVAEPRARHRRAVGWIRFGIHRHEFDEDLQRVLSGRHTVQSFKGRDAADRLRRIANAGRRQRPEVIRPSALPG